MRCLDALFMQSDLASEGGMQGCSLSPAATVLDCLGLHQYAIAARSNETHMAGSDLALCKGCVLLHAGLAG